MGNEAGVGWLIPVDIRSLMSLPDGDLRNITFDVALAFSPGGTYVASGDRRDHSLTLRRISTGTVVWRLPDFGDVKTIRFSGDDRTLAAVRIDGAVSILNSETATRRRTAALANARYLALDQTGERLAVATSDAFDVWDLAGNRRVHHVSVAGRAVAVALSPDGTRAAYAEADFATQSSWVRMFNVGSSMRRWAIPDVGRVQRLAFTPDGRQLAVNGEKPYTPFLDAATGAENLRLVHRGHVRDVAFDGAGRHIAMASEDRTLRIYDLKTKEEVLGSTQSGPVLAVAFAHDESSIWSASDESTLNGQILVAASPLSSEELLRQTCRLVTRKLSSDERRSFGIPPDKAQPCANLP